MRHHKTTSQQLHNTILETHTTSHNSSWFHYVESRKSEHTHHNFTTPLLDHTTTTHKFITLFLHQFWNQDILCWLSSFRATIATVAQGGGVIPPSKKKIPRPLGRGVSRIPLPAKLLADGQRLEGGVEGRAVRQLPEVVAAQGVPPPVEAVPHLV